MLAAHADAFALTKRERRSGNLPEVLLWRALRMRPGGFKFRRQHPIGHYCLDFACLAARLCIEVDGEAHDRGARPQRDAHRDAQLRDLGSDPLRVRARDVLENLEDVTAAIVSACKQRQLLHQPAAGPPPRSGEVLPQDLNP